MSGSLSARTTSGSVPRRTGSRASRSSRSAAIRRDWFFAYALRVFAYTAASSSSSRSCSTALPREPDAAAPAPSDACIPAGSLTTAAGAAESSIVIHAD